MVLDLHREFPFQHEEELPSLRMEMTLLLRPRWHQLFDNAQFSRLDQMPTIAIGTQRWQLSRPGYSDRKSDINYGVAGLI